MGSTFYVELKKKTLAFHITFINKIRKRKIEGSTAKGRERNCKR